MQEIRQFFSWGLLFIKYSEPFSATDLMEAAAAVGVPGRGPGQHRALLVDLRKVDISDISGSDSRRFIAARKMRMAGAEAEPVAFVIRSSTDFAYIRMHNLWAEALGLRGEELTLITPQMDQALNWLETVTNQPGLAKGMLRDRSW